MSFFNKRSSGRIKKPLFMAMYAPPGVGKSSFAASFPGAHFYDFEESTHCMDVSRSRPLSFEEVMYDLQEIRDANDPQGIKSLIFDTIDELERLIHKHVAIQAKKSHIENIGWQKGYDMAVNHWADFISICREVRDRHQIHFLFLAHSTGRLHTDIEQGESFSRHAMGLHKKAADYIFGQVEMVLFAKKDVHIKIVNEKVVAKDTDRRVLCTSLNAHYDAKNRIGLPPTMPMPFNNAFQVLWDAYQKAFDETPESVLEECILLTTKITDMKEQETIIKYCEKNKSDITILRTAIMRIKEIIGSK